MHEKLDHFFNFITPKYDDVVNDPYRPIKVVNLE